MSSRIEQKRQLREERERRAAEDTHRTRTRRRLGVLAGLVATAAVVVVALVLVGGATKDTPSTAGSGGALAGVADTRELLRGIPQRGTTLGRANAPVTLVQYVDLQCPYCAEFDTHALPTVIRDYVRTGKVRIQQRTLSILGADSETAARHAVAASERNRLFQFSEVFYRNQGEEKTGYVTPTYLAKIARAADLDAPSIARQAETGAARRATARDQQAAQASGLDSTPSFALGRTGGTLSNLQVSQLSPAEFTGPIDRLLGSAAKG